jgi:serine/threonine protein kinase, bacterial
VNSALDRHEVAGLPRDFLSTVGEIFAEFGRQTQDSGNRSFGVRVGDDRYFVKTAGDPDDVPFLTFDERVTLLRNAVRVAQSCTHETLPELRHVIESKAGPMLVYACVDGDLLGVPRAERSDPTSSFQRFRSLAPDVIVRQLTRVYDLHRALARLGWIAVDFYDGSLIYDFERGCVSVVDIDMYHAGPFINDMGRMFGSSRFMAPEEFEKGALIDERTNVFVMGRTAAVFLGDGTLDRSTFRGTAAMYDVVTRACAPDRDERYSTMEEFRNAWDDARD